MKKFISLICVLAIALSMVTFVSADVAENEVLINEDFENIATVAEGDFGDFDIIGNQLTGIENGELTIGGSGQTKFYLQTANALTGEFVVEFEFMQPVKGKLNRLMRITNGSGSDGATIALDDGCIYTYEKEPTSDAKMQRQKGYNINAWNKMKIVVNETEKRYDMYLNDELIADDYSLLNVIGVKVGETETKPSIDAQHITRLMILTNASDVKTYIDNLRVYRGAWSVPDDVVIYGQESFASATTGVKVSGIDGNRFTSPSSNNNTVAEVEAGNNAIKFDSTTLTGANVANLMLHKYGTVYDANNPVNNVTDNYVVEFKWKKDTINATTNNQGTDQEYIYAAQGYDTDGTFGTAFKIRLHKDMPLVQHKDANGAVTNYWLFGNTSTKFVQGQWYKFKIHVNMAANTFDVYIDDKCVAQSLPFTPDVPGDRYNGLIRVFMTHSGTQYKGVSWIDDIKIYEDNGLDELFNLNVNIKGSNNWVDRNSVFQTKTSGGYDITWTGDKFNIKAVDGKLSAHSVNVGSVTFVPSINYNGRIIEKRYNTTLFPTLLSTVLGKIEVALTVDTTAKTVTGKTYGAGDIRLFNDAYLFTCIYSGDKLVKSAVLKQSNYTSMPEWYTNTIDISDLPVGTYTAKGYVLKSFTSLEPLMAASSVNFEIAE